jgi:hypothetical protein
MAILAELVKDLRIESAWTPALIIKEPFAPSPPSPIASAVGSFLRPRVTVTLATGQQFKSAPYGDPGASQWPLIQGALLISAGLGLAWLLYRRLR